MGTLCLGYSWATLPQGYIYGGMAIQLEGRAKGRQPITVKKLSGKPNWGSDVWLTVHRNSAWIRKTN